MKKIAVLILALAVSITAFGAYLEVGGSLYSALGAATLNDVSDSVFSTIPVYMQSHEECTYGIPISKNLSVAVKAENYFPVYAANTPISGTIGLRYTFDWMNAFVGINGGALFENGFIPLMTADFGVAFKITDNIYTYWEWEFHDSFGKDIIYDNGSSLPSNWGGIRFVF